MYSPYAMTWLFQCLDNTFLDIPGYNFVRLDRSWAPNDQVPPKFKEVAELELILRIVKGSRCILRYITYFQQPWCHFHCNKCIEYGMEILVL